VFQDVIVSFLNKLLYKNETVETVSGRDNDTRVNFVTAQESEGRIHSGLERSNAV
jgi:hypothetical protein